MITWLTRQFRYFFKLLHTNDSPRQLAYGVALGFVLGLTPKGNLLAVFLAMLLFTVRVNVQAGMLSALGASFIAAWFDPISHRIGDAILNAPALRNVWTRLYNTPFAPWTDFNNTIVLGSFVLGWVAFIPTYRAALPVFNWRAERRRLKAELVARQNEQYGDQVAVDVSADVLRARQLVRRQRFQEFVAEVESISQRRGAA